MKNITFLILSLLFLVTNPVGAVRTGELPQQELKTEVLTEKGKKLRKQKKKSRGKGKGLRNTPSLLSAIFGAGSLAAVIGSIAASFALSGVGVLIFALLGLGFGIIAIVNGTRGIKMVKEDPSLKGSQGGAVVGLFVAGLALLLLLALTLGAIFG